MTEKLYEIRNVLIKEQQQILENKTKIKTKTSENSIQSDLH